MQQIRHLPPQTMQQQQSHPKSLYQGKDLFLNLSAESNYRSDQTVLAVIHLHQRQEDTSNSSIQ